MKQTEHSAQYDRFMDAIKLQLILWRRDGRKSLSEIARSLGISERTLRRRCNAPGTFTLEELFTLCTLYDKDPHALLQKALDSAGAPEDIQAHS